MTKNFPKLRSESAFPNADNINVYKYDNELDYSRYNHTQMSLMLCSVPWDMGEARVGNRSISGIGNVVYFESKENRDAWFAAIPDEECYRFETKYKELHRDNIIDVPIPYDVCARHNYLVVKYNLLANDDSLLEFERVDGQREWFWFVREVEFVAPNTTRLHLVDDAFQTWIYDVNISSMILERGHAPMFAVDVDDYLANPVDNAELLLTEDVNYGEATICNHIDVLGLNSGNMYACICTNSNVELGNWGSKSDNWRVPGNAHLTEDGIPSIRTFAVPAAQFNTFMENVSADVPQFKQTVKAVFFASSDLITLGESFAFANTTCYRVNATRKTLNLTTLSKQLFGYDSRYANIAKLYTSPYAHIEVTDENGAVDIIKIEDSTGEINASVALSISWPFITINAHLLGTGGNAGATVTYKNINERTFNVSGTWYDTLRSWNVPTFAVILSPQKEYDYSTHYDRAQRVIDYTTNYDNASASATTEKSNTNASALTARDNAYRSADTARDNEHASADTVMANAKISADLNRAMAVISNAAATDRENASNTFNDAAKIASENLIDASALSTIAANEMQAALSTASTAVSGTAGAIGAAAGGDVTGAVSNGINALTGAVTTEMSMMIANAVTQTQANINKAGNTASNINAKGKTHDDALAQRTATTASANAQNLALVGPSPENSGTAGNSRDTMKANANRSRTVARSNASDTKDTTDANATRTYNTAIANAGRTRSQAISDIENDIAQAGLRSPFLYGEFANGDSATTKPIALFSHIVTQSKAAIAAAGDDMLRYGYMLDKQWAFDGNWNVGRYFTYWKLRDFWVRDLDVPDYYMDRLRFFLFGGVTVWRDPGDIGKKTIYENAS